MIIDTTKPLPGLPRRLSLAAERREGNRSAIYPLQSADDTGLTTGAFYAMRTVVSGGADNGDIYLQGGQVSAGTGTETVADILLYDASLDSWSGTEGDHLIITANGTGDDADSVLLPVFNLTSAPDSVAASVGGDTLPSIGSLSGSCKVSLGVFGAAGFFPDLPGNIQISFCFGGFTRSRF